MNSLERIIALCRTESRALLNDCDIHYELAERGLRLVVSDKKGCLGGVAELLYQEHLERLVESVVMVSESVETLALAIPGDDPLEMDVKSLARLYRLDQWAGAFSNDQRNLVQEFCRYDRRCRAALNSLPKLTFVLDKDWMHLEVNDKQTLMVAPWEELAGKPIEEIPMPQKAVNQIMDATRESFYFQEIPHYVTYQVWLNGLPKRYRARIVAYGGQKGEAIAQVEDITLCRDYPRTGSFLTA